MTPLFRLTALWFFLLPASTLWLLIAQARGLPVAWSLQLPLALDFTILALVINALPLWQLGHRRHVLATLGLALALAMALGGAEFLLARILAPAPVSGSA